MPDCKLIALNVKNVALNNENVALNTRVGEDKGFEC